MVQEAIKLGQRGTLTIPQHMRAQLGLEEGALLLVELREGVIEPGSFQFGVDLYVENGRRYREELRRLD